MTALQQILEYIEANPTASPKHIAEALSIDVEEVIEILDQVG